MPRNETGHFWLDLRRNAISPSIVPAEILDKPNVVDGILAAYRAYRDAAAKDDLVPLNEVKLLVVGKEAVGKTSLVRYLLEDAPRNESERRTPGIAHQRIETSQWTPGEESIKINVWDFGGQEIMRGTHRFFLTKRSLYLLVLNARLEDDRSAHEWLLQIANAGGDSPVIVVVNKADMPQVWPPDETAIRREFPNVVEGAFIRTCCDADSKSSASIAELRKRILTTLKSDRRLDEVRARIPRSWERVKLELETQARSARVLAQDDFRRICEGSNGQAIEGLKVLDRDEQFALLRILHDIGVVVALGLTEGSTATIREVTLLDPNWLTQGIYALLNHARIAHQHGVFTREDMKEILNPQEYPSERFSFLLETMRLDGINLCYPLDPEGSKQRFLMPEALPPQEPSNNSLETPGGLRFWYQYDDLPSGLVPQFIVRVHPHLPKSPQAWRSGVVFTLEDCQVQVRGNSARRRVEITVHGREPAQRRALAIVQSHWKPINDRNPAMGCRAMVPIPDQPSVEPESYEHLLTLERKFGGDYEYIPRGCEASYRVRDLLDGVRMQELPSVGEWMDERPGSSHRITGQQIAGSTAGRDIIQHIHMSETRQRGAEAVGSTTPSKGEQTAESASAGRDVRQSSGDAGGKQSVRNTIAGRDIQQSAGTARDERLNFLTLTVMLTVFTVLCWLGYLMTKPWLIFVATILFVLVIILVLAFKALESGRINQDTLKAIVFGVLKVLRILPPREEGES